MTLNHKLLAEARQERVCATCGYERQYRRVWRQTFDTFVGGRVAGPDYLRGAMTLVCLGCRPEFVVNPYEAQRAA